MTTHEISFEELHEVASKAYNQVKDNHEGKNADYIPYLDNVDSELFALTIVTKDARIINLGDSQFCFGVESVSKVFTAILAMQQLGPQKILEEIGADATGLPFNSIMAILLENSHPSTPLVNSGAISAVSMIEPRGDGNSKWQAILDFFEQMCGSGVEVIDELYESEAKTNFNNRSIAWLLKNYDRIYDDPDLALDLYTRQCSLGVSTLQLATAAATIAFEGANPTTGKTVFDKDISSKIISLMATVGFYEHTGRWMYECGLPAKTGVGGGIMGVAPGQFGIAAFSPRLDGSGNSVRAQAVIKLIANRLGVNIFANNRIKIIE